MEKHLISGFEAVKGIQEGLYPEPSMALTIPMKLTAVEKGAVEFTVTADHRHLNPMGGVHGGFAATALDSATGAAVHTMLEPGESYGTVDLNVKMLKPVSQDKALYARGKVLHMSKRLGISEATLVDGDGKIYAHATCTCMILRSESSGNVVELKAADKTSVESFMKNRHRIG